MASNSLFPYYKIPIQKTEVRQHSQLLSNPEGNNFVFFSVVGAIHLNYSTQRSRGLEETRGCSLNFSLKVLGGSREKAPRFINLETNGS